MSSEDTTSNGPTTEDEPVAVGEQTEEKLTLAEKSARAWTTALFRAARWADARDRPHPVAADGAIDPQADPDAIVAAELRVLRSLDPDLIDLPALEESGPLAADQVDPTLISAAIAGASVNASAVVEVSGPGATASAWAVAKAALSIVGAPVTVPTMTVAALRTAKVTRSRIELYPEHLHALAGGGESPLPLTRVARRAASTRYVITSDLHRCIPGRLDWPERQGTKELYHEVLSGYADEEWHLIENGDVEDYWMVGGSTWGAVYDVAYLTGAVGPSREESRRTILREQLDRIVENNESIYSLLRDRFCAQGRYLRTMGNHDDAYTDPKMVDYLTSTHLPGAELVDNVLLCSDEAEPSDGIAGVSAVICHGHLTDSWNGPGFAPLGRSITWLITGLDDLPKIPKAGGLPDEQGLVRLLAGRARNRLITVDPRYGGNRRFDSLDEQRLFARLADCPPDGGEWPWLIFGHTHFPMLWPQDAQGDKVKYANSGCGVLDKAMTCLEWDSSDSENPLRLVVWLADPSGARRIELIPDGPTLRAV
ncbi:unannotated protein [freshwater metagenome]|uniref:Unannotated protein n=1 Tax=freshwater metagenome TaxID=449393 RepID=A0A6J7HFX6_9ZZZZ|nr:hypothetical protein [Actinomycetota bacterium]